MFFVLSSAFFAVCQPNSRDEKPVVSSAVYTWKDPNEKGKNIRTAKLFEGSAYDLEYLRMEAVSLVRSGRRTIFHVPADEEQLLIVKSGTLKISIRDSSWIIGPASIALLMPGETYRLQNPNKNLSEYYVMKYRSKLPVNVSRGQAAGGSFVKNRDSLEFKPNERGGTRRYFEKSTAMCKRFEMHVTTLNEGLKSHDAHTHRAEEIIVVIENKTEMQIGNQRLKGKAGDVYFMGSNILHGIRNDGKGPCSYFAFQFE